jgi:hypothetical protein
MISRWLRSSVLALAWVAAGFAASSTSSASAACYSATQALPAAEITAFTADAAQLLQQNPDGGPAMISRVRDLAASDPATLPILIGLLANANANQRTAIGTGLGQAAQICVRTDQAYAAEIQRLVAASGIAEAITALAAVIGDRPIGALGGGPGSLGAVSAGAGGPTNSFSATSGAPGTPQTFGTRSVTNSFAGFTAPGSASPGSTTTNTTTTTTITQSVSP